MPVMGRLNVWFHSGLRVLETTELASLASPRLMTRYFVLSACRQLAVLWKVDLQDRWFRSYPWEQDSSPGPFVNLSSCQSRGLVAVP